MAIFDKKLREIASTIKDDYIKKYVLEYFLDKISELAPHTSRDKKNFYIKKTKPLDKTKKHYNESQSLSGVELKEFSLLYLVLTNLKLIKENLHLIENVRIYTEVNKQIFENIIFRLKSNDQISIDKLEIDVKLIDKIKRFAPIKHILKNKPDNEQQVVIEFLEDVKRDLNNYDLEYRIQQLESKFSKDMSESTFNELKELKKKQNIN